MKEEGLEKIGVHWHDVFMQNNTEEPMEPSKQFCPNLTCSARGQIGEGNITIHDRSRRRYRCKMCRRTFSERRGTLFFGLRKPTEVIVIVVTLLSYGCPIQAIVHAFGLDERTVAAWRDRAGAHCEQVHHALVERGQLDLVHVQADELRVKGRKLIVWMGLAMMVSTRLWLAGTVSLTRDKRLADALMQQVRRSAQALRPLLVLTDGWAAYPNSIQRAFREKVKAGVGRGRAGLQIGKDLHIGTVIKRMQKKRIVEITRRMTYGAWQQAEQLLLLSAGGKVLNSSFIERLNGTFRERLASLTRKCRHSAARVQALSTGMYLLGCTYNFCLAHQELSKAKHWGRATTPAMASGLTDHVWSVYELFRYKVAPAPWVAPKKRGRPSNATKLTSGKSRKPEHLRPLFRLRKGALCSTTV